MSHYECTACRNRGILFAHPLKTEGDEETVAVIFRCSCNVGMNDRRSYPVWKEAFCSVYRLEGETPKETAMIKAQTASQVSSVVRDPILELPF